MKRVIHKPHVYYTIPLAILWFILLGVFLYQSKRTTITNDVIEISKKLVTDNSIIYNTTPVDTWRIETLMLNLINTTWSNDKVLIQTQELIKKVWWIEQYFWDNIKKMYRIVKGDGKYTYEWNPVDEIIFAMYEKSADPLSMVIINAWNKYKIVSFYIKWYKLQVLQDMIFRRLNAVYQYSIWNVSWATIFYKNSEYAYVYNPDLKNIDTFYSTMNNFPIEFNTQRNQIYIDDIYEEYMPSISSTWTRLKWDYISESWKWYTYEFSYIDGTWWILFLDFNIKINNGFINYIFE